MAEIPSQDTGVPDFQSGQPEIFAQAKVWNDTVLIEDAPEKDTEAFQADLPSLVGDVGKWVVYFKGTRLGIFRAYNGALDKLG